MDENYYRRRFLINYLLQSVPEDMMERYMQDMYNTGDGDGSMELQDFIGTYIKNEHTWMTNIGLIDAMDSVIKSVKEEGYLNMD